MQTIAKHIIFTDAATSPQKSVAVGAFLCLTQQNIENFIEYNMRDLAAELSELVVYKIYESKKSTWSEIKTLIDALSSVTRDLEPNSNVEIYTDCQSLCDLIGRRKEKLLTNNFRTRTGKLLANTELYKELFAITEKFKIQTFKIKGHNPAANRLTVQEKIFGVLDKLSRTQLRSILQS